MSVNISISASLEAHSHVLTYIDKHTYARFFLYAKNIKYITKNNKSANVYVYMCAMQQCNNRNIDIWKSLLVKLYKSLYDTDTHWRTTPAHMHIPVCTSITSTDININTHIITCSATCHNQYKQILP